MSIPSKIASAANVITMCVDEASSYEVKGRLYHSFAKDAIPFCDVITVIRTIADVCNMISYPQSTVHMRSLTEKPEPELPHYNKEEPLVPRETVLNERGKCATFCIAVTSRTNANWQGELYWAEQKIAKSFCSDRELLVLMLRALTHLTE